MSKQPQATDGASCGGEFQRDPPLVREQQRNTAEHQEQTNEKPSHAEKLWRSITKHWKKDPISVIGVVLALILTGFTGCQWRASVAALRTTERAWIYPNNYVLSAEPTPANPAVKVTLQITNSGRTPAVDVMQRADIKILGVGDPYGLPPLGGARTGVIFPSPTGLSFDTTALTATEQELTSYLNNDSYVLIVTARITYRDVFGIAHFTTVCVAHRHGQGRANFSLCPEGNDVDRSWVYRLLRSWR